VLRRQVLFCNNHVPTISLQVYYTLKLATVTSKTGNVRGVSRK